METVALFTGFVFCSVALFTGIGMWLAIYKIIFLLVFSHSPSSNNNKLQEGNRYLIPICLPDEERGGTHASKSWPTLEIITKTITWQKQKHQHLNIPQPTNFLSIQFLVNHCSNDVVMA